MSITAEQLRSLHEIRKQADLRNTVNLIAEEYVIAAAQSGHTSVLVKQDSYQDRIHQIKYFVVNRPSLPDLVEALRLKFPDVIVEPGSQTTILVNGIFVKKHHILIDWSLTPLGNIKTDL